ncbi:hypothetical protein [Carbonactinospora thermoautotrophica]|uniref:hypothetical protein n=1 Tax=Carbonactinospora thermoautotrophica TaxID=1469144 RepID=UPI002270DD99|nr:hypothetical protein [Carbonactinospora thermoautotrophica]
MSQEARMRELFEQLVRDEPPMTIHAGDIIYEGRRALRRRRLWTVSALSAAAVCVLAATATTLTSGIRTDDVVRPMPPAVRTTSTADPPGSPTPTAPGSRSGPLPERLVHLLPRAERTGVGSRHDRAARLRSTCSDTTADAAGPPCRPRSTAAGSRCRPLGSGDSCRTSPDGSYLPEVQRAASLTAVNGLIVQVQVVNGRIRANGIHRPAYGEEVIQPWAPPLAPDRFRRQTSAPMVSWQS